MNNFILGLIFGCALYGLLMLLFKDLVIRNFIKTLIDNSKITNENNPLTEELFSKKVIDDILVSYRLLLILKREFEYLASEFRLDTVIRHTSRTKLAEVNDAIRATEEILDNENVDDYKKIKAELQDVVDEVTSKVDKGE